MKGTVKSFNKRKGYGFIVNDEGATAFFHYSELKMDGFKTVLPDNTQRALIGRFFGIQKGKKYI